MKQFCTVLLFGLLGLLTGCNGSSGENEDLVSTPAIPTSLSIKIFDEQGEAKQSYTLGEKITIQATLRDQYSNSMRGQIISFSSTLGTLSPATKLTDNNGVAAILLSNDNDALGAGKLTASFDELSTTADFEFIQTDTVIGSPTVSLSLELNGVPVNRFKSNEQAIFKSRIVDEEGLPLVNQIVNFSADIGTLTPASALTDSNGLAAVSIESAEQLGAGIAMATYRHNEQDYSQSLNYEVISADSVIVDDIIKLGYFDDSGAFVEGEMKLSIDGNTISAGGTLGIAVALVDGMDQRIITPTPIEFSSNCVTSELATIDATVFTINAIANSTFEDQNCGGISGTQDVLIATVTANGETKSVSKVINIEGENLGSIEFISAEPSSIVLKGTGGQGKQETSTLTFAVKSALGNPLAQQQVEFSLNTEVGGLSLNPVSGITNSQGLITTRVTAGTVPTAVRVTAIASITDDQGDILASVQTQSDLLSVNTGLPEQSSFTLSGSILNPEADSNNGVTSLITAWLADSFNNPVPDGTTVNFSTEGGSIDSTCSTINGRCSVTWTSAEPRVADHRVTILATALGHETFFDTNGNNMFDDNDGDPITSAAVSSGFGRIPYQSSGFVDLSEAWRDDNENQQKDPEENLFLDFNNNQSFDLGDGMFNGPQCQGSKCSTSAQSIHVRKALVIVMSGSQALYSLGEGQTIFLTNSGGTEVGIPDIGEGVAQNFELRFSDSALQPLPFGTQVQVTATAGELQGTTSFVMPNTNRPGAEQIQFVLINENDPNTPGDLDESGVLTITFTTPNGIVTSRIASYRLLGE